MNPRQITAAFALVVLSGCVTHQYDWDNYDGRLYKFYKDPTTAEEFRISMKAHLERLEARGLKPAPGLYAELGTLFLEHGDSKTALTYYQKERATWVESQYLMDAMIASIERRPKPDSK